MNKQPKNHHRMVRFASVGAVNAAALAPCPRKRPKREHPLRRRKPKRQGSRNQTGKRLPMMTSEKRFVNGSDGLNTTERKQINGLCSCPQGLDVRQVQISFQPDQASGHLLRSGCACGRALFLSDKRRAGHQYGGHADDCPDAAVFHVRHV